MSIKGGVKLIAQNKKAYHDYFVEITFQAGISLAGTEVKSMRAGKCSIKESYIKIVNTEAFIYSMYISPYENGSVFNKDSLRPRRLLLHKKEIKDLFNATKIDGYTIVPLRVYLFGSYIKIDIGLAKGKKLYDKRHSIAKSDIKREAEKDFKLKVR